MASVAEPVSGSTLGLWTELAKGKFQSFSHEYLPQAMGFMKWAINHFAPLFIVTSPVTSYADQIWSISKRRTSAGFSLDIPLIMLVASLLKIFFWFGDRYDTPLLMQAIIMIFVQILLLRVSLLYRPPPPGAQNTAASPFETVTRPNKRPYEFWQWRNERPYWQFLGYYAVALCVLQLLAGSFKPYITLQGYVALSVEAVLPIPQILENRRAQSCKGFRLTVLINWLIGDTFKLTYFFLSEGSVPWAFKLCGLFQAACDAYLGVQYLMYGEGPPATAIDRDIRLA